MAHTNRSVSFSHDHHAHLIAWWDSQENASAVVRAMIEDHIAGQTPGTVQAHIDLAQIRQIIEAVMDQKLSGLALMNGHSPDQPATDEISDFEDLLA